jgi:hypothetical protein
MTRPAVPTTKLIAINQDGVVKLADGTFGWVAPGQLSIAQTWKRGADILVAPSDITSWPRCLTNVRTGERVNGRAAPIRF